MTSIATSRIDTATTLWDLVERRAAASSDRPFLHEGDDTTITYAEFAQRCLDTAAGFADLGIGPGSKVVWQLPTSIDTVVAAMALARLGAVQTPVLHLYRDKEMGFCINAQQPDAVITPGVFGGHDYEEMVTGLLDGSGLAPIRTRLDEGLPTGDPSTLPPAPTDGDAVRWIYWTSGTTSDPKGVRHTDNTLMSAGIGLGHRLEVTADDVGSMVFPYAHIAGPDYTIMMLWAGMSAMVLDAFTLDRAVELYNRWNCTIAGGSTVFYTMFLGVQRANPGAPAMPSLRMLAGGGAPMPAEIYTEVLDEMGVPVCHGYGMTECPMIAQGGPSDSADQLANTEGEPVPDIEITIVDDDGNNCPAGTTGEVRVKGPMVFAGYTNEALNAEAFDAQGRFRTGDLGMLRDDGYITLTGRLKDIIIRKAENISATEVEEVLYTHPAIGAVAVIGIPDKERGEMVCAVVELADGVDSLDFASMQQHCVDAGLMRQKTPERLEVIDRLPRNDTLQKVLKYKLREQFGGN